MLFPVRIWYSAVKHMYVIACIYATCDAILDVENIQLVPVVRIPLLLEGLGYKNLARHNLYRFVPDPPLQCVSPVQDGMLRA